MLARLTHRAGKRRGARKREEPPCPRLRVMAVCEARLRTRCLEHEGQAPLHSDRPLCVGLREAGRVHRRLPLDTRQGCADRLRLDHTDDLLVDIQQVVDAAITRGHDELAHRDAEPCEEVQIFAVLNNPTGRLELLIDENPSPRLCGQSGIVEHGVSVTGVRFASGRAGRASHSSQERMQPGYSNRGSLLGRRQRVLVVARRAFRILLRLERRLAFSHAGGYTLF